MMYEDRYKHELRQNTAMLWLYGTPMVLAGTIAILALTGKLFP